MSNTDEKVAFVERHEPLLKDGEYTIKVTQDVSMLGQSTNGVPGDLSANLSKTIYVAGERYSIESKNIFRQYPPPNKTGDYSNVLPHIELTRSTLPWERTSGGDADNPWMFLFVYDDDDIAKGFVKKPAPIALDLLFKIETSSNKINPGKRIPLDTEPGDEASKGVLATKEVQAIQLNLDWLNNNSIFPREDELQLMTSVRENYVDGATTPTSEHAICMANRLPKKGVRSYACLLSLEGRLRPVNEHKSNTLETGSEYGYEQQGVNDGLTSFVCLAEWSFTCVDSQSYQVNKKTTAIFDKQAKSNSSLKSLPGLSSIETQIDGFKKTLFTTKTTFVNALQASLGSSYPSGTPGQEALISCFKIPDHTFEWYLQNLSSASFGSDTLLVPTGVSSYQLDQLDTINEYLSDGALPFPHHLDNGGQTISWYQGPLKPNDQQSTEQLGQPILASDQLLRYDSTLKMLDVSYAAAWELGRMMTLKNKSVSMDLYSWKRQHSMLANRATSRVQQVIGSQEENKALIKEETAILDWVTQLTRLKGIPFNYLVPNEEMLPNESIRFFSLDTLWINCLLDGALSIGRVSNADAHNDYNQLGIFQPSGDYCGFILRSEMVSGWPNFEVSAKAKGTAGDTLYDMTPVTQTKLGPNIVLLLFEGGTQIHSADIHLKPEALHFGFDVSYAGDTATYSKEARFKFPETSGTPFQPVSNPKVVPIVWQSKTNRVVDMSTLCSNIYSQSGSTEAFSSAQFAMEMIEGVPNVIFTNEGSQVGTTHHLSPDLPINASMGAFVEEPGLGDTLSDGGPTNLVSEAEDDLKAVAAKVKDDLEAGVEKVETAAKDVVDKIESLGHRKERDKPATETVSESAQTPEQAAAITEQLSTPTAAESAEPTQKKRSKAIVYWLIAGLLLLALAAIGYWLFMTGGV